MNKTLEQALDEVVADIKAKQKQNAKYLAKIHKLKRENRTLSAKRKARYQFCKDVQNKLIQYEGRLFNVFCIELCSEVRTSIELTRQCTEQIINSSIKIMRLRMLIKQSKV